ncbi:MAG: hypothetical protein KDB27_32880 [Planctomycetales bacterium]|nr:hypothetical protein [Planctomycetales bacterium]
MATVAFGQTPDAAESSQAYLRAVHARDQATVESICESWIETGRNANDPGLRARGLARKAYAAAIFASMTPDERRLLFDEALAIAPQGTNLGRAVALVLQGSHERRWSDDLKNGLSILEEGLLMARELENDELLSEGYSNASQTLSLLGRGHRSLDYAMRALRYGEHLEDDLLIGNALFRLTYAAGYIGCDDGLADIVRKHRDKVSEQTWLNFISQQGEPGELEEPLARTLEIFRDESKDAKYRVYIGIIGVHILMRLDRVAEAQQLLMECRELLPGGDASTELGIDYADVALKCYAGQHEDAIKIGGETIARLLDRGHLQHAQITADLLSKAHLELGNTSNFR